MLNVHLVTIDENKLQAVGFREGSRSNKGVVGERMVRSLEIKYKGKRQAVEAVTVNPCGEVGNVALAICSFNVILMLNSNL